MTTENQSKISFEKIDDIMASYEYKKSNLIAILQQVQELFTYLPEEAMTFIGTKIEGLSPATVYGVATFYAQFSLEPKGKYKIKVCDGTACHVRGSMSVLNAVKTKLRLGENSMTTEDGMFSLEIVSCLGACGLAPVVTVNGKVYGQVTVDDVPKILDNYRNLELSC